MDEGEAGSIQGQLVMNAFVNLRLTNNGGNYWVNYIFANGRRIAALEAHLRDSTPGGCDLSTWSKLKYMTLPVMGEKKIVRLP